MRLAPVGILFVTLLALTQGGAADSVDGSAFGVDGRAASAGGWHAFTLDHAGGSAIIQLSWDASLLGADYDLTLYRVGALDDGALSQGEVIGQSWQYRKDLREESIVTGDLAPGRYVVTVEPIQSLGETYHLSANGGLRFAATTVGTKLSLP